MSQNNPENHGDGILLIDKEEGITSYDVVKRFKRIPGFKKVGHAGTLDPFATGLLIILIGQGTKLSSYLMAGKKRYLAGIKLGVETDTLDPTGKIIKEAPFPNLNEAIIKEVLKGFEGEIEQIPPAYSAVNIDGQRAYKLARKGIDVKLKKRNVSIYSIRLVDFNSPEVNIEVTCSSGTYIRTLASDIGKRLGSVAHLKNLRRVSNGPFNIKDALDLEAFKITSCEGIKRRIIPLREALPDMIEVVVDDEVAARIKNGHRPDWEYLSGNRELTGTFTGSIKLVNNASLLAILDIEQIRDREDKRLKKIRVFN